MDSLNKKKLIRAKTTTPILNPMSLDGQISPLKLCTKYSTDFIYNQAIGIDADNNSKGYL
jgi:hypothetical protein